MTSLRSAKSTAASANDVCSIFGAALLFVKHSRLYDVEQQYDRMITAAFSVMAVWGASESVRAIRWKSVRNDMCSVSQLVLSPGQWQERAYFSELYRKQPFSSCQWKCTGKRLPFAAQAFLHDWEQLDKQSVNFKALVVRCAERYCQSVGVYVKKHLKHYLPPVYRKQIGEDTDQHIGMQLADVIAAGDPSVSPSARVQCSCDCCARTVRYEEVVPENTAILFKQMFHVSV